MRAQPQFPCLDWMKAIGIALVVYGHVAHATTVALTPPVYLKQFGVTLFVFATGFTLARDRKPAAAVVLSRVFPMYFYGLLVAALVAAVGASTATGLAPSNLLPFLGGVNVLFDHFPANPSTWYVGTYLHLLLLWAWLFRTVRVQWWMVAAAAVVEIIARALMLAFAGPYIAYMFFTSWITVFVLGMLNGSRTEVSSASSPLPYALLLLAGGFVWAKAAWALGLAPTFPLMTVSGWDAVTSALTVSIGASTLYFVVTALVFEVTRRLPAPAVVRLVARNSLIVFLAHMPIFFALNPVLVSAGFSYASRVAIELGVCGVALTAVSEMISRLGVADALRARLLARHGGNGTLQAALTGRPVLGRRSSS
jgi:peptidoglycan/LPS O-acetylase OafA/YrhL